MKRYFALHLYDNENKVRLFICDKDVKPGDYIHGENGIIYNKPKLLVTDGESGPEIGNWANIGAVQKPYKKLGLLSPKAKWVSDGMEFDDDDLAYGLHTKVDPSKVMRIGLKSYWDKVNDDHVTKVIMVKCPNCEHFH